MRLFHEIKLIWIGVVTSQRRISCTSCLWISSWCLLTCWKFFWSRKALLTCFGISGNTCWTHGSFYRHPHTIGLTCARTFSRNLLGVFSFQQNFAQILIVKCFARRDKVSQPNTLALIVLHQVFQERSGHVIARIFWNFLFKLLICKGATVNHSCFFFSTLS